MSALAERRGKVEPLLLPDRDEPYELHDVLEKVIDGCRDEIVLSFGDSYLSFKALPATDEIAARFHARKFARRGFGSIGHDTPWRRFVSENCGWTWLAVNQQGYWDTALISFDAVVPNVLLNVMGSSIFVFSVGPMDVFLEAKESWGSQVRGSLCQEDAKDRSSGLIVPRNSSRRRTQAGIRSKVAKGWSVRQIPAAISGRHDPRVSHGCGGE